MADAPGAVAVWLKLLRRTAVALVLAVALVFGILFCMFWHTRRVVAWHDQRYEQVERGMSEADVRRIMGGPPKTIWTDEDMISDWGAWWEWERISEEKAERIATVYDYDAPIPLFMDILYRFSFDREGMIIGKHRHD